MPGPFSNATAVQLTADGQWLGSIQPGWDIAGDANGGYLLAMAARALVGATRRPDPITVTAHYLAPGRTGEVHIVTRVLKRAKRFATATATVSSGARPLLAVLGTLGHLAQLEGPELVDGAPPEIP
ncbi:MAG TPA: acyl-CoA thioesterase domain-containing protein [Acidimicrobiales bacterium]|nr:acyl-CoA thioesterase domain-containing protein [Acidimicrobiales bacterium]